jgi:asparagine synthetase B (glutamine-hydrolysing)
VIDSPLTPLDVASGMLIGTDSSITPLSPQPTGHSPREALQAAVRRALLRPPCLVSFSGGRDSSALLAMACHVARNEGLALPIPATVQFPGDAAADESEWQDHVLAELGLKDRWQYTVGPEMEVIGTIATDQIRRHGLRYPPNVHFHHPIVAAAAGGSLISGIGGDELLTPHLWSRLSRLGSHELSLKATDPLRWALANGPRQARGVVLRRYSMKAPEWLRPAARRQVRRRASAWLADQPVRFDELVRRWWWTSRYFQHGSSSLELLAGDFEVEAVFPFMDPMVLNALADLRGRQGFASRTAAMEWLFGDLLPERVIARPTKAIFDGALVGPMTRQFIDQWSGEGEFDHSLVDPVALHQAWKAATVDVRSLALLQQVWFSASAHSALPSRQSTTR